MGGLVFSFRSFALLICVFLCLLGSVAARAGIITNNFSGVLTSKFGPIPNEFSGIFSVGDSFHGRFVYDTKLIPFNIQSDTSFYDGFSEFSVTINGLTWTASQATGEVSNNTNTSFGVSDVMGVRTGTRTGPYDVATGPRVAGLRFRFGEMQLQVIDGTGTAFGSTALPTSTLDLSQFKSESAVSFLFWDTSVEPSNHRGLGFWGEISSITNPNAEQNVPEPPTYSMMFFGLSLAGLVAYRKAA